MDEHKKILSLESQLKDANDRIGELQNELDDTEAERARLASQVHKKTPLVEIERIPENGMYMQIYVADGTIDGRKFKVGNNAFGGDIIVDFERLPDEPKGSISKDRFIVKTRSVIESIWNHIAGEKS